LSLCKSRNCVVPIVEFSLSTANDFAFEELQLVEELEDDFDLSVVNMLTIIFWFNTNPKIIATDKIREFVFLLSSMSINTIPTVKVTPIINNNLINDKMLKLLAVT